MFYAKLTADKKVIRYPYTLPDLRLDTPGTSFPIEIDDATAASFGVVPVKPTTPPQETHTINLERTAVLKDGIWVEKWLEMPATKEQIQERTASCANDVRQTRNQLLAECDWTQLSDAPTLVLDSWKEYRQGLRNVPKQQGFPWNIIWPQMP
ncbi:Phage tail assembly chaperone protein [uncultured Caudovirales phage]|uniref:Phage tail assembly chaperone protein n=1 Tax=uncultured Caudovirales phage TaxID=2100421 RepID=A0A6J7X2P8_9CAUD|nr:Phage tail assembly chaperone protein [uncultured Caudovirales phage]